jgi:hypothetical protein
VNQWRIPVTTLRFQVLGIAGPCPMRTLDHGTYGYIIDLGTGQGRSILPPGNGRADSAPDEARFQATGELPPHADDQLELYERWAFKPMRPMTGAGLRRS